jgi:hypothetical protein
MTPQRTQTFVPLTAAPAAPDRRDFSVTVVPGAEKPPEKNFQSLGTLRSAPAPAASENKTCEPRVSVQREGDRVTHLRIQCTCGQVMDLACLYEKPAAV